jgi:phosphotransferase system IIB component
MTPPSRRVPGLKWESIMWQVQQSEVRSLLTRKVTAVKFEVRDEQGNLYGTLDTQEDAEIVAFGLNNSFVQSILGGFADNVVTEIKKAMAGETPAEWAIER